VDTNWKGLRIKSFLTEAIVNIVSQKNN